MSIFYNQLHYILATLANGLADPEVDKRIVESLENDTDISCSQLFEWCSSSVVGITVDEYRILKNFTCDLDPDNFNAYTDLYMAETTIWRKPAYGYRSYLMTVIGDAYDFAKLVSRVMEEDVTIEAPFSRRYLLNLLRKLRDALEDSDRGPPYKVNGAIHRNLKLFLHLSIPE